MWLDSTGLTARPWWRRVLDTIENSSWYFMRAVNYVESAIEDAGRAAWAWATNLTARDVNMIMLGVTLTIATGGIYMKFKPLTLAPGIVGAGAATAPAFTQAQPVLGRKLDYLFGFATGNQHNIHRSTAMLNQMNRIGISDTAANRAYMTTALTNAFHYAQPIAQGNGRYLREFLLMGPLGGLRVETIWEAERLITIFLIG